MLIKVKKLRDNADCRRAAPPPRATCAPVLTPPVTIAPGETKMIGTGLSIAVPEGYFWRGVRPQRSCGEAGRAPGELRGRVRQ